MAEHLTGACLALVNNTIAREMEAVRKSTCTDIENVAASLGNHFRGYGKPLTDILREEQS